MCNFTENEHVKNDGKIVSNERDEHADVIHSRGRVAYERQRQQREELYRLDREHQERMRRIKEEHMEEMRHIFNTDSKMREIMIRTSQCNNNYECLCGKCAIKYFEENKTPKKPIDGIKYQVDKYFKK